MNIKELRQLEEPELDKKVTEIKKELVKINSQVATGQGAKAAGQAKTYKKTLARIKTLQNERKK